MIYNDKSVKTGSKRLKNALCRLLEEYVGLYPYPEQVKAATEIYKGNIVDMKTGEGKTLAVFLAMLMAVRDGHKVFVVTSNDYLSERDYNYSKPLLKDLGIRSIHFKESVGGTAQQYKDSDVIYATGETLIFDYLRGIHVDYDFAIVDEIDYILVECANHDFSVSDGTGKVEMPASLFFMCRQIANMLTTYEVTEKHSRVERLFDLQYKADVIINRPSRSVTVTNLGYEKLSAIWGDKIQDTLYMEALQATLLAKYCYLKGVHYVVKGTDIIIINDSSGRISPGGENDINIQTAIEVKEGVAITDKAVLHNTCSYPVFFTIFPTLTGLSGTTSYVPYDFGVIYQKSVKKIREHFPNQRKEIFKYFSMDEERCEFIKEIVAKETNPILLVGDSDERVRELYGLVKNLHDKSVRVLTNKTLDKEKELLEGVKRENAVLISNKIVGRGTDIDLPKRFEEGLTVILAQRMLSERAERQIIGRTGRNGRKGTAYILTAWTDCLFDLAYKGKKKPNEKYVRTLQNRYEQRMFEARKHIYIRSKLFFDQDRAVRDRLKAFTSYEEILEFSKGKKDKLVKEAVKRGYKITKGHNALLLAQYDKIRPYYQQQFLTYNDNMAQTLYQTDTFQDRCHEYIDTGRDVIMDCVNGMLARII